MQLRLAATALVAAAALAACGGGGNTPTEAGTGDTSQPAAVVDSPSPAANDQVDFVGSDVITGDQVDVAALSQNDLVIWFWAPW